MRKLILIALLAFAFAGNARTKAVIFGDDNYCHNPINEKLTFFPRLAVIQQNTILQRSVDEPFIMAIAPGPHGRVLAASLDAQLFEVRPDGTLQVLPASIPQPSSPGNHASPLALTVDARGNIIAFGRNRIYVFDARGALLRSFLAFGSAYPFFSIDLAADQCTLYQPAGTRLQRFDVCTGTQLSSMLLNNDYSISTVRVLPDGDLLIGSPRFPLRQFDPAGNLVRTYPGTNPMIDAGEVAETHEASLMLVDGGRRAWYSVGSVDPWPCTSRLMQVDLESGATSVVATLEMDEPLSLAPANAWWAAAAPAAVPTLSQWSMLALMAVLLASALTRTTA